MIYKRCSYAYFESSQRRMGGFSVTKWPVIKPLPFPRPREVTVFLVLAFNPTTGSVRVLGFLGRRLDFSGYFLLVDGLAKPVPLED